jgi:hypothetical protein
VKSGTLAAINGKLVSDPAVRNLAIVRKYKPLTRPFGAGRIECKIKLVEKAGTIPNAAIVFGYQDDTNYRYVRFKSGKVFIGRTGDAEISKASAAVTPGTAFNARVDVHPDGKVEVFVNGVSVLTRTFDGGLAGGGVGLAANKAKATFDNFKLYDETALP